MFAGKVRLPTWIDRCSHENQVIGCQLRPILVNKKMLMRFVLKDK